MSMCVQRHGCIKGLCKHFQYKILYLADFASVCVLHVLTWRRLCLGLFASVHLLVLMEHVRPPVGLLSAAYIRRQCSLRSNSAWQMNAGQRTKRLAEEGENRKPSQWHVRKEERRRADDVEERQHNQRWGREMSGQLKVCFQSWLWLGTVTKLCSSLTHSGKEV